MMSYASSSFNEAMIRFLEKLKFEGEHVCYELEKKHWYASVIAICCDGQQAVREGFLNIDGNRRIKKETFLDNAREHSSFESRDTPSRWKGRNIATSLVGWLSLCHSEPQRDHMIGFIRWMGNNTQPSIDAYRTLIIYIKRYAFILFKRLGNCPRDLRLLRFCEMWTREVVMKYGREEKIADVLGRHTIIDRNGKEALAKLSCHSSNKLFFIKAHDDRELCCLTDLCDNPNSQPVAVAEAGSEKGNSSPIEGDPDGVAQGHAYSSPSSMESDPDEANFVSKEDFTIFSNEIHKCVNKQGIGLMKYRERVRQAKEESAEMAERLDGHTDKLDACMARTKLAEEELAQQATKNAVLHKRIEVLENSKKPEAAEDILQHLQQLRRKIESLESGGVNSSPIPEQDRKMAARAPARDLSSMITPKTSTRARSRPTPAKMPISIQPIPTTPKTPTGARPRFPKASSGIKRSLVFPPKGAPASSENKQEQKRTPEASKISTPLRTAPITTPKISTPKPQSGTKRRHSLPTQNGDPASSTATRSTPTTSKISTPSQTTQKGAPANSENEREQKRRRIKNPTYDSDSDHSE
jgi:hypothetical protein